jgi:hypothetical protein
MEDQGNKLKLYLKMMQIKQNFNLVIEPSTSTVVTTNNYSYDDLFPALPESATPRFPNVASSNNIKRIGSSVVTQVIY